MCFPEFSKYWQIHRTFDTHVFCSADDYPFLVGDIESTDIQDADLDSCVVVLWTEFVLQLRLAQEISTGHFRVVLLGHGNVCGTLMYRPAFCELGGICLPTLRKAFATDEFNGLVMCKYLCKVKEGGGYFLLKIKDASSSVCEITTL